MTEEFKTYTPEQHVLNRPGTYIGSTNNETSDAYVCEGDRLVINSIRYNPGLAHLFNEVLSNAGDHSEKTGEVSVIKVKIGDTIKIMNDGPGITSEIHHEHGIPVPQLIFGRLFSGSNYDDTQNRTWAGVNGIGVKAVNIFSSRFKVETGQNGIKYTQIWENNMNKVGKPKIEESDWTGTIITYTPDYERFGLTGLDEGTEKIIHKRVLDLAATQDTVQVYYNGKKIPSTFEKYVDFYLGPKKENPRVFVRTDSWDVVFACNKVGKFTQVSFVNGIPTLGGGTHVNHVVDPLVKKLTRELQDKNSEVDIRSQYIKDNIFVCIMFRQGNPTFDSQTKERLKTPWTHFDSTLRISDDTVKKIVKLGICNNVLAIAEAKALRTLSRTVTRKVKRIQVDKLDDANNAGGPKSFQCTLIITEGDSAKTLAISGLQVVGRDNYGVWPLKGKPLNLLDATLKKRLENVEMQNFQKVMGLRENCRRRDLRYNRIMIMTDQDDDGFHIKGLVLNALNVMCPQLMNEEGFVCTMITPIVKAKKGSKVRIFYNMDDYRDWKERSKGWTIKYYKGLGTSTSAEAKEYFRDMSNNVIDFDTTDCTASLDLAFRKDKGRNRGWSDRRKDWIREGTIQMTPVNYKKKVHTTREFVNDQLRLFSMADVIRSIPSMVDGFKPSQRKVLFSCLKRKLYKDLKVAQLAGYVSEVSAYHHGEMSLYATIINMAQNYCGAGNINLLEPSGQFGTRLMGGKDSASPRYVFTRLTEEAKILFNETDSKLLEYNVEEGIQIEPKYYVPSLPLILVNGSNGIGTGFSTKVPCFNPEDIKENLRNLIENGPDAELIPMTPWYRGFSGNIEQFYDKNGNVMINKWVSYGIITSHRQAGKITLSITELPVGVWTEDYIIFLTNLETKGEIYSFLNNSSECEVNFTVTMKMEQWNVNDFSEEGSLENYFHLAKTISATNMYLFDSLGEIKKYDSAEEILRDYFLTRMEMYRKRLSLLREEADARVTLTSSKARFIESVVNRSISILGLTRDRWILLLNENEFPEIDESYEYIFNIKTSHYTAEKIRELREDAQKASEELEKLLGTNPDNLWIRDLNEM